MYALFAFFAIVPSMTVKSSNFICMESDFISSKSEKEVLAYIAKELDTSPETLDVPDYKCCTCFNVLRDQFFRMVFAPFSSIERKCEKLGLITEGKGIYMQ